MNRIKDFFYDKNDILVAFLILAIAALIIYTRIDSIMAYPDTLLETSSSDAPSTQSQAASTTAAQTTAAATTAATTAAQAPKSIVISEDSDSTVVSRQLSDAGLVSSAEAFEAALKKYNMTSQIQSGTFTIPAGATTEQIIELITGKQINN